MKRICWLLAVGLLAAVPAQGQAAIDRVATLCQNGFVVGLSCSSVDVFANLPVSSFDIGEQFAPSAANDLWGWTDPDTGHEYALASMFNGVTFVDVTNPEDPLYLGALRSNTVATTWRDVKVYENHAFIVADGAGQHGVQVFDLTQLRTVTEPTIFEETARYTGIGSAHNIVINEETGFAYSVGSSGGDQPCGLGLHIIDVREPAEPDFAGCFNSSVGRGYTHDAQCVIYRGPDEDHQGQEICIGADERGISIADVTNKSQPVELSTATYPTAAYTHQGWLTDDHRYYYQNDEADENSFNLSTTTYIWDLVDLDAPELVAEHRANTSSTDHNLYIVGDYMYQANYGAGFRLLDISDRLDPVEIAYLDTAPQGESGAWSVYPFFKSGTVLVSDISGGLFLVRPAMPLRPAARNDYATTSTNAQVRIEVGANDLDPNGEALTLTLATPPANGTATVNADGSITYRPNRNFSGRDGFAYAVQDPTGGTDAAEVSVQVNAPDASMARAQLIHNMSDPAVEVVDVYIGDELIAAGLEYQHGTDLLTLPGGTAHELRLLPADGTPDAEPLLTVPVTLGATETYVLVLQGVTDPDAYERNPDGFDTALSVALKPDALLQARDAADVDVFVAQGVIDAGGVTVSMQGIGGPALALGVDLDYGAVSGYQSVPPGLYQMVIDADGQSYRYKLDVSDHAGEAITLLLSGFLDAAQQNRPHPAVVLSDGQAATSLIVAVDTEGVAELPDAFSLSAAYPNPFNPATSLDLTLAAPGEVTVAVYDLLGRRVATLHEGLLPVGTHALRFDAAGLSSGTYFVRATGAHTQQLRAVSLLK